ncbi:MAG: phosphate ABC transporter permease subunit PstC [Clostridia bacterium]|nr:phosphate ABC transporter permease subunit PstC [Clostridia bacterium]
MKGKHSESIGKMLFLGAAILCVISIVAIFSFLILRSIPFFQKIGLRDFLFGEVWSPDRYDTYGTPNPVGSYGILPMLVGTLLSGLSALLFGGTLGVFFAVFLVFFCPKRLRSLCNSLVLLLAGIPSVVYGFFGISFLLPIFSKVAPTNGSGLLATTLILGTMILPTVVALFKTALEAVPKSYYTGAVGLGSSHVQAVFCTMVPSARAGMRNALLLGLGRALGETMAVILVAGNAPTYPAGLFRSFRVLTANIAMEMSYAGELQEGALIATGCVLLVLILILNLLLEHRTRLPKKAKLSDRLTAWKNLFFTSAMIRARVGIMILSGVFVIAILIVLPSFLVWKGLPTWLNSPSFLFGKYEFGAQEITLLPSLVATLMAMLVSLAVAIPTGVMAAVYLHEYATKNGWIVRTVRRAVGLLNGVPSIVYGLFGMMAFLPLLGGSASILAGALTVSILLLPTVIRATEESLSAVEAGQREGSFALGEGKTGTVLRIVLPAAFPGILSAVLLSIGRVLSESAPFLYTMGSVLTAMPRSYFDRGTTLAAALYQLAGEGWHIEEAYATALILLIAVFALNLLTSHLAAKLHRTPKI